MSAAALPLVVITGPTGTGKSDLALQLAARLATRVTVEIVSADSALVFRGMDIGTAKPTPAQRASVAHHLIDIRDPAERYSAGEFVRDAHACISAIHQRGHLPLLVGGTLLYLRALREGLASLPQASPAMRAEIDASAARLGWPALHQQLRAVDPAAAARIAATDGQRIQRALEVQRLTGVSMSEWQQRARPPPMQFNWLRIALLPPARAQQRARLAARFEAMLDAGLLAEVQGLYRRADLSEHHPSVRAVGYRQLWQYCAGRCSLPQARELAVTATAQLAKRQMTWLRRETGLLNFDAQAVGLLETVTSEIVDAGLA